MCTGKYDRLSTRTFELSTDMAAVAGARYRRPRPLSIFFSLSAGLRSRSPPQDGPASGPRLAESAEPRVVGRLADSRRVLRRFLRDRQHRVDERIERILALGLRRLDHQRTLHDQRKIDRRRVEAVVEEPLRDVERVHVVRRE